MADLRLALWQRQLSLGEIIRSGHFFHVLRRFSWLCFSGQLFSSRKKEFLFFIFCCFFSAIFAFLFQFLHLVFGINIIPFNIFPNNTSNLIGGWNDFSIFFWVHRVAFFGVFGNGQFWKIVKAVLLILFLMSFLSMATVNFFDNWIVFGVFSLLIFIMALFNGHSADETKELKPKNFFACLYSR